MYHGVTREPEPDAPESSDGDDASVDPKAEKKERVLHTRVPAVLEAELKRFAQSLRVPVSNLVRTILEDAVNVADAATENVESRLKQAAGKLEHERQRLKQRVAPDPLREVFAFQTVTLAQPVDCAKCKKPLAVGERAHLGLTDGPPSRDTPRIFVCDDCTPKR